jgi:hypothetical protein
MKNFILLLLAAIVCNLRFILASNNPLLYTTIGNVEQAKQLSQCLVVASSSPSGSPALSCLNPASGEVKWNVFLKKNSKVSFLEADDKISLVLLEGNEGIFLSAFLSNDGSFLWELELPFEKEISFDHCSLTYDHELYKATLTKGNQQILIENVLSSSPKLSSPSLAIASASSSNSGLPSFESKIESNTLTLSVLSSSDHSLLASSSFPLSSSLSSFLSSFLSSEEEEVKSKEETFLMSSSDSSSFFTKAVPTYYLVIGSFHAVFQFQNNEIHQILSFQQKEDELIQFVKTPSSNSFSFFKVTASSSSSSSSSSSFKLQKEILKDSSSFPMTVYHLTISNSLFSSFSDDLKVFDLSASSSSSVNNKDRKRKEHSGEREASEKQFLLSSSSGISFFFSLSSSCHDSSSSSSSCDISQKWIRNDGIGRISKSQYFIISSKYHHHSHDSTVLSEEEEEEQQQQGDGRGGGVQGLLHSLTSGQFFQQFTSSSSSGSSETSENSASCRMNRYLLALSYSNR